MGTKIVEIKYSFEKGTLEVLYSNGTIETYRGEEAKKMIKILR